MNIREFGFYFAHNRKGLLNRLVMEYHIPIRPWWSIFWHEAHLYDSLEVRGMDVIDVGCDYGVTPMYFLARGARSVTGFSEWEPRFYHSAYLHHTGRTTAARIREQCPASETSVMKADVEGLEWDFIPEWIDGFRDWIIVCHEPVKNPYLLRWLLQHGHIIGRQPEVNEFTIIQKRKQI